MKVIGYASWEVRILTDMDEVIHTYRDVDQVGIFNSLEEFEEFKKCHRSGDVHQFTCTYKGYEYTVEVDSYTFTYNEVKDPADWTPTNQLYILEKVASTSDCLLVDKHDLVKSVLRSAIDEYKELD